MFTTTDKTLVSWFCFDEEAPKHCSVITVQAADKYDALAFGKDAPGKWSTASDDNARTQTAEQLAQNPAQDIVLGQFMMMAAVYKDNNEAEKPYGSSQPYGVAPFALNAGENLNLRIFIDRALVEVFINERQAVVQSQLHKPEDVGICLYSRGGDIKADATGWKMAAANQW